MSDKLQYEPFDRVCVVRPVSEMEWTLVGRKFQVVRMDRTHGYVVVSDAHGSWHVHPESLEPAT